MAAPSVVLHGGDLVPYALGAAGDVDPLDGDEELSHLSW